MIGNNPYATSNETSTELSTNAEVYSSPEIKLAVLQIRSPILQTKYRQFQDLILTWIKTSEFSKAIILSSSHAYQRDDRQLLGTPLRYLLTPAMQSIVGDNLQMMNWKKMEKIAVFPEVSNSRQHLHIPGGGITKQLYNVCCSEGIPLAVLLVFCSEGDNMPDAFVLINYLNEWLHLVENAKPPPTPLLEAPLSMLEPPVEGYRSALVQMQDFICAAVGLAPGAIRITVRLPSSVFYIKLVVG
ncbi:UNVERIFIED_CONTAM: hypothetical protein FKN15_060723 [Acipenser sinensis]